jgi:hypothetical protein
VCGESGEGPGAGLVLNCVSCSHHRRLLPPALAHRKQLLISPGSSAAFQTSLSPQLITIIVCAAVPDNRLHTPARCFGYPASTAGTLKQRVMTERYSWVLIWYSGVHKGAVSALRGRYPVETEANATVSPLRTTAGGPSDHSPCSASALRNSAENGVALCTYTSDDRCACETVRACVA